MNPTTLSLYDLAAPLTLANPPRATTAAPRSSRQEINRAPATLSPAMQLHQACRRQLRREDRADTLGSLLLGVCSSAALGGCVLQLERFIAHWPSFEAFVRALLP